ncbi:hypothetical protein WR25_04003 [Diploscapter pachys]|uniref:YLPM1-like spectrin repeat domain-containing protein n=1 Tax=Diploscapter pachys TaxID=2018661 RepID=A0A2A2JAB2_9BILA|nr:hypothetical protein WR25_04003 [Diploscapter pachys]
MLLSKIKPRVGHANDPIDDGQGILEHESVHQNGRDICEPEQGVIREHCAQTHQTTVEQSLLSPEDELEKQYRDYKAQFEQWKEKNKSSVGTEAYNSYVKQFHEWEKDVEKRRRTIRERVEREAAEKREKEEMERRILEEQKEAEAAEAYVKSQQAYLQHHAMAQVFEDQHRKATPVQQQQPGNILHQKYVAQATQVQMQMQSRQNQQQTPQQPAQIQPQHATTHAQPVVQHQNVPPQQIVQTTHQVPTSQPQPRQQQYPREQLNSEMVMREVLSGLMGGASAAIGGATVTQQPPPSAATAPTSGAPPQLWGNTKMSYDMKDPLFARWGQRAAPHHLKPGPLVQQVPVACWMLGEQMREKKMMIAPRASRPPVFAANGKPNGRH